MHRYEGGVCFEYVARDASLLCHIHYGPLRGETFGMVSVQKEDGTEG
ncbi:hypothetical protein [uncultured Duncaniella sp.]|nr:hypothetical protein [uncultured Duncaniella sp.]